MYGWKEMNCRFCGEESEVVNTLDLWHKIYICPNCGVYLYYEGLDAFSWLNSPEQKEYINFPSYLYYHHIDRETHVKKERNYIGEEKALKAHIENEKIDTESIKYNLITDEVVRDFLPKTLQEKEKFLLADIYKKRDVVSDITEYTINQIQSAAFVIRQKDFADNYIQFKKLLLDLKDDKYIEIFNDGINQQFVKVKITTKGIKYIENGDTQMGESEQSIQKQINLGPGSTYIEKVSGNNNTVGTVNNRGIDFNSIITLVDKIETICNENKDKQLQPEIIESINDNLSDIRSYISQKNESGIIKGLKTIRGLLFSASISVAANLLTPEIQAMITTIKNCIGA